MSKKLDFLKECNQFSVPLEEFELQFCSRCVQPDCHRSQYGKDRFDQRVQTWLERLVTEVPRMKLEDPRYDGIHTARFIGIETPVGSISTGWDQEELVEGVQPKGIVEVPNVVESVGLVVEEVKEEISVENEVVMESAGKNSVDVPSREAVLINTPPQRSRMLQSGVPLTKPTSVDKWAAPVEPAENVVKPGAKIKLGGP